MKHLKRINRGVAICALMGCLSLLDGEAGAEGAGETTANEESPANEETTKTAAIDKAREDLAEKKKLVSGMLEKLTSCRNRCQKQCLEDRRAREEDGGANQPASPECSFALCDTGECQATKDEYNRHKKLADQSQQELDDLEKSVKMQQESSKSPLSQVHKKRKNMGAFTAVGAATTAFLGYKTVTCCSSPGCRESGWCWIWGGMTAAAGVQTGLMANKKKQLKNTESAMCVKKPGSSECIDDGEPEPNMMDTSECKKHPSHCKIMAKSFGWDCDPGDESCPSNNPPTPTTPAPGMDPRLTTAFTAMAREEGRTWPPKGMRPFASTTGLIKDLSPKEQEHVDEVLAPLHKSNAAYLAKKGIKIPSQKNAGQLSSGLGVDLAGGEDDLEAVEDLGADMSASQFSGGEASLAGSSGGPGLKRAIAKKKPNSLADQMKQLLGNLRGNKKTVTSPAEKSVQLGNDIVGVAEDNIFMMAHRRHRSLAGDGRFIARRR